MTRQDRVPSRFSRGEFRRIFADKYAVLLRALFDPALKRSDLTDPATIERVLADYRALAPAVASGGAEFPKHIWMLWQQGWDEAPPIVDLCARSWRDNNPGWQLHLLDEGSLPEHAPAYDRIAPPRAGRQARANLARLSILAEHGGVWADSSLFCARPLDEWLPGQAAAGLFVFSWPRPYRPLESWFIAAANPSSPVETWLQVATDYWRSFARPHHYFWMEYLFEALARRDPAVGAAWERMPKLSALGPLLVNANAFDRDAPALLFDAIRQRVVPVHKLKHKWRRLGDIAGTPLGALTGLDRL